MRTEPAAPDRALTSYNDRMEISRRTLARMLAASTAVGASEETGEAQTDADLAAAHEDLRSRAQEMANVMIPMTTEPAVHFKA